MKKLICLALTAALLSACASDPKPVPVGPAPEAPRPVEKPPSAKRILQSEAETTCRLEAIKRDGVRLSDVAVVSTKKVDAGYLAKLKIGDVERTCILTPEGEIRSYQ